jgi:WD40 repeat protein
MLVAGCYNNTARIWNLENGACNIISTRSGSILSITLLPKRLIALGCINGSVEVWKTNKKGANLKLMETIVGRGYAVKSLAFVQLAGKRLVIASEDASLKYLDVSPLLDSKKALANHRTMAGGNPLVQCMMRLEVTGNKVCIYPSHILLLLITETIMQECVTSIAISPDRKWVVSGSDDHCIQFCDLGAATIHSVIQGHNDSVTSVDFSQRGNFLVTGGKDGKVRMCTFFYFISSHSLMLPDLHFFIRGL